MPLFIRLVISLVLFALISPLIKAGQYTHFALILSFLGTLALVCGSEMTGRGFAVGSIVRNVTVDQSTPGCVWKVWGWFCWIVVLLLVIGSKE